MNWIEVEFTIWTELSLSSWTNQNWILNSLKLYDPFLTNLSSVWSKVNWKYLTFAFFPPHFFNVLLFLPTSPLCPTDSLSVTLHPSLSFSLMSPNVHVFVVLQGHIKDSSILWFSSQILIKADIALTLYTYGFHSACTLTHSPTQPWMNAHIPIVYKYQYDSWTRTSIGKRRCLNTNTLHFFTLKNLNTQVNIVSVIAWFSWKFLLSVLMHNVYSFCTFM